MTPPAAVSEPRPAKRAGAWHPWALVVLATLLWLPGLFNLPALDRDESRFAQATHQMIETGNFVDIRLGTSPRYNKPVGIYWLQSVPAAAGKLLGVSARAIWLYRLPSFFGGLAALLLLYACARLYAPPDIALIGAVLLGLSLLLAAESEIATTDAVLLATVVAAQGVLLRLRLDALKGHRTPTRTALAGWAAVGAAVLIKGPVVLAVTGATALSLSLWDRDWRWLRATRPLPGIAIAALIVAPWAIAIGLATHGAFFQQSLGHDFAEKVAGGQESHGAPPGYYLALLSITFWPATLFMLPALHLAWRERGDPVVRYLLCWAASSFLLFELVPTKLPHYILPAYPALALLAALWFAHAPEPEQSRWQRAFRYVACAQFALAAAFIIVALFLLPARFEAATPPWAVMVVAALTAAATAAVVLMVRRRQVPALVAAGFCALLAYPALAGIAPFLKPLWISERVALILGRHARRHDPPLTSAGYAEPSLLFMAGGDTRLTTGDGAANITAAQGGLALIEDRERPTFLARLADLQAFAAPLEQFSGFDYSNGRKEHFTLYRVSQVPQEVNPPDE